MGKYLGKSEIMAANDAAYEDVPVPEWGGTVRIKRMSAAEKDAFEASLTIIQQTGNKVIQRPNLTNVRAKLAASCIVDESGAKIFDDGDIVDLGRKSGAALDRVVEAAKRLNRMTNTDLAAMTESLKNDPPVASPTA